MTYLDYLEHPMGKGVSMGSRIMREELIKQYNMYIQNNHRISAVTIKDGSSYFCLVKVESRTIKGIFYDVVLEFTSKDIMMKSKTIDGSYDMRVYNNAPSFNFTYAHAFNSMKMLSKPFVKKYEKIVLKEEPEVRNPSMIINYDRILLFAILYMIRNKLMDCSKYADDSINKYVKNIESPDVILTRYNREKKVREHADKRLENIKKIESDKKQSRERIASKRNDNGGSHIKSKKVGKPAKAPKKKR